jgi:transcription antitermination factor NusG
MFESSHRMLQDPPTLAWFALRVRSNLERVVAAHLRGRNHEEFCPLYKIERRWSDRNKVIECPLFPGYVFCRLNPNVRLPAVSVPGVIGIVGFGKVPSPIPEKEIQHIRTLACSGSPLMPWPFLQEGQRVLIERGPLKGVEGILSEIKGKCRLIVSVTLLQRSVAAEIERSSIRPVGTSLRAKSSAKAAPSDQIVSK